MNVRIAALHRLVHDELAQMAWEKVGVDVTPETHLLTMFNLLEHHRMDLYQRVCQRIDERERIQGAGAGLRWVRPGDMHPQ